MSSSEITGCIVSRNGARGTVLYAKVRAHGVDGPQTMIRLGKLWPKRSRPAPGFLTMDQANARLQAIKEGDDPQVNVQPSGIMFGRAVDEWLKRDVRGSTDHDYKSIAKTLKEFFGESTPLEDVTKQRRQEFRDSLKGSPRTVNKYLGRLEAILRDAAERHDVDLSVARVQRRKERKRKLGQYLTAQEVYVLSAKAPTEQEKVLYEVAAFTGLRWGELRALRWRDVRFADSMIQVVRNWPVHGSEDEPKSDKPRSVPLWDQAAMPLARLRDREHFTADDDYVFCQETGKPLGYDWTIRRFKAARDDAGLTNPRQKPKALTFHGLRHSYGTLAAAIYKDLRQVQEYMGHASITTTELYASFLPRTDAAMAGTAGLSAMLGPDSVHQTMHPTAQFSAQQEPSGAS